MEEQGQISTTIIAVMSLVIPSCFPKLFSRIYSTGRNAYLAASLAGGPNSVALCSLFESLGRYRMYAHLLGGPASLEECALTCEKSQNK